MNEILNIPDNIRQELLDKADRHRPAVGCPFDTVGWQRPVRAAEEGGCVVQDLQSERQKKTRGDECGKMIFFARRR
jgi:hypothetical protein